MIGWRRSFGTHISHISYNGMDLREHDGFTDEARPIHDRCIKQLSAEIEHSQRIEGLRVAEASVEDLSKLLILNGGRRRGRTADANLLGPPSNGTCLILLFIAIRSKSPVKHRCS
jgi:hypothetical protein